jgi:squalene-hopene/tetraprenyl-beta-curcumene cyclase
MLIPLAIINHFKPRVELPEAQQLPRALSRRHEQKDFTLPRTSAGSSPWRKFLPPLRSRAEADLESRLAPMRKRALEEAERWMLERIGEGSDGLAAVIPGNVECTIRVACPWYPETHPVYKKALAIPRALRDDAQDFGFSRVSRPCGTRRSICIALAESGVPANHPAVRKAAEWLVDKEGAGAR